MAVFIAGSAGVMVATDLASRAGKLYDPLAVFLFLPVSLVGALYFVACYRRAERSAKQEATPSKI